MRVRAHAMEAPVRSRNSDTFELVVRWYLRFNGYLGVENFVVHEPACGGVPQGTETDVLAVRFPHSVEYADFRLENDSALLDEEACAKQLVDFVIAEVKGGRRGGLNHLWRSPSNAEKTGRVKYILRWLGPLSSDETLERVAQALQQAHRVREGSYVFRLLYFGKRHRPDLRGTNVRQITFEDIARFFVTARVGCWVSHGLGVRSAHDQWHPEIRRLWSLADPSSGLSEGKRIKRILRAMGGLPEPHDAKP